MNTLSFPTLRAANTARLPLFKNKFMEPAHSKPDGSDWSPSQWLQAVVGELGEFANIRKKYERGDLTYEQYQIEACKELADVQTYLDILAMRALDTRNGEAHETGVDLAQATVDKFNEVSKRVRCNVFIMSHGQGIITHDWPAEGPQFGDLVQRKGIDPKQATVFRVDSFHGATYYVSAPGFGSSGINERDIELVTDGRKMSRIGK